MDSTAKSHRVLRSTPGWPCCSDSPEKHFRAWQASARSEAAMAIFVMGCRVGEEEVPGQNTRAHAARLLQPLERLLDARTDCLAWAGLRRILVAERSIGLLPRAPAVAGQLTALFRLWEDGAPANAHSATDFDVPRTRRNVVCPDCGVACGIRVPAWVQVMSGPRTGLQALASPGWRSELGPVAEWAKDERVRLTGFLGSAGASIVLRCQIHQAVSRFRLTPDIADLLVKRSGVTSV